MQFLSTSQTLLKGTLFALVVCCVGWNAAQADDAPLTEPQRLTGQKYPILWASFSADGKRIAVLAMKNVKSADYGIGWSLDGEIGWQTMVWDVTQKKVIHSLSDEDVPEEHIQFRPGQLFPEFPSMPSRLGFSGNGELVVLAGSGPKAQVFDVRTGKLRPPLLLMPKNSPFAGFGVSQLAISPDGKLMAACRQQGVFTVLQLYDTARGGSGRVLHGKLKMGDILFLDFSTEGDQLIGTGAGSQIWIWDVKSGRSKSIDTSPIFIERACLSADGESVIGFSSQGKPTFSTWDIRTRKMTGSVGETEIPPRDENTQIWYGSSSFSADGSRLAKINAQRQVLVFDVQTGKLLQTLEPKKQKPLCVSFSPDGKTLATGGLEESDLLLWEISN